VYNFINSVRQLLYIIASLSKTGVAIFWEGRDMAKDEAEKV